MRARSLAAILTAVSVVTNAGCGSDVDLPVLTVDMPLHLEDHIEHALVTGSTAPSDRPQAMEWRFDEPSTDWSITRAPNPVIPLASAELVGGALRVTLADSTRRPTDGVRVGGVSVEAPLGNADAWGDVIVRIRSDSTASTMGLRINMSGGPGIGMSTVPLIRDGAVHTYRIPWLRRVTSFFAPAVQEWDSAGREVRQLALFFNAVDGPGSVDILSVRVPPVDEPYYDPPIGVQHVVDADRSRRTLYVNAPSRLEFRVAVPDGGRFDYGMRVLRVATPVTFRVAVRQSGNDAAHALSEEIVSDASTWLQRSVDLSSYGGETVTLVLENDVPTEGAVALWSAPTVSGSARSTKPNVIFYVIDTGGADQMSLYGYNRRTTPHLEALAQEGAVFEWAHSTANNTPTSTPSFMTSLHHSVLGEGSASEVYSLPTDVTTMAEHFHHAGYETAVFTWNPNAGRGSGLHRGVDLFYDGTSETYNAPSRSSVELHQDFWEWREAYPGAPYWVHFQTLDVHRPTVPPPPFAGLFAPVGTSEATARQDSILRAWEDSIFRAGGSTQPTNPARWADTGIDRVAYYNARRALYDETMAHQDYQLGRFVERLKESGEWDNTLLVIASDHSIDATEDFQTLGGDLESIDVSRTILRSTASRVPLVFIWPGRVPGGQRIRERVSMIDVLPTVLELVGLPQPDVLQGQSLVPLLMGRAGWQPRPVIFDQYIGRDVATGDGQYRIEVIDGRWGAALWIGPPAEWTNRNDQGLLLYDVVADPMAHHPVNDEHPDLVAHYTKFLNEQFEAHQLLAKRFTPGGAVELTAEQIERLRTLGYVR
jgi:arylsulfatase A-like enzyme